MRKIFTIAMVICSTFAIIGCEETPEEPKIDYQSNTEIDINPNQEEATIKFSVNTAWSVSLSDTKSDDNWIEVEPMSGGAGDVVLTLDLDENETTEERTKYIKINAGETSKVITVTQKGAAATITIDENSKTVDATNGEYKIELESNTTWSTSTLPEWITLSAKEGEGDADINLTYEANPTFIERTATITFTAGGESVDFTITQEGIEPYLTIKESSVSVGAVAGTVHSINLSTNTTWSTSILPEWITLSAKEGEGDASIILTYEANPTISERTATITFTAGGESVDFTITQEGAVASITLSPNTKEVGAVKDMFTIEIVANGAWSIGTLPEWVTLSATSGDAGTIAIFVTCDTNVGVERTGTIEFTMQGMQTSLTITQNLGQIEDLEIEDLN